MIKLLFDQNFNKSYIDVLISRITDLDFITALAAGLSKVDDPLLLRWADENGRVLLTHDRKTMPRHYASLIIAGKRTSGVIVVPNWVTARQAVDELELLIVCTEPDYWIDRLEILK